MVATAAGEGNTLQVQADAIVDSVGQSSAANSSAAFVSDLATQYEIQIKTGKWHVDNG